MNRTESKCWIVVLLVVALGTAAPAVEPPAGYPAVDGMLGVQTADGHGWMAIKVDFAADWAMAGIVWYNNDSEMQFSALAVGTGFGAGPGSVDDALVVGGSFGGGSDAWSEISFDQPVAASLDGLYVILEFPAGSAFTSRGEGGGPAVGFSDGLTGPSGWISGDGETWHRLAGDFGFAMAPVLVPFEEGMAVKSLDESGDDVPDIPEEYYVKLAPNPFNPRLAIRFGLPLAGRTTLKIFDVRGRLVAELLDEKLPAGHHEVFWNGDDRRGRPVASGIYLVRVRSGDLDDVQRATLVR